MPKITEGSLAITAIKIQTTEGETDIRERSENKNIK